MLSHIILYVYNNNIPDKHVWESEEGGGGGVNERSHSSLVTESEDGETSTFEELVSLSPLLLCRSLIIVEAWSAFCLLMWSSLAIANSTKISMFVGKQKV